MIIDTRFNPEDKVWAMYNDKPELFTINTIRVTINITKNSGPANLIPLYDLRTKWYDESTSFDKRMVEKSSKDCFATKKELLDSFL
jgi:hypothetical protein